MSSPAPRLSVNLNKVALLRNQRDLAIPSLVRAAATCVEAGAHGITLHPRPDERHVRRSDVLELAPRLPVELNLEGNPFPEFLSLVHRVEPAQCTLVPDSPEQATSDHGWQLRAGGRRTPDFERLAPIVTELRKRGMRVSLFLDADPAQIEAAAELGVDRIELYTEPYARAFGGERAEQVFETYVRSAECARALGLGINAGHDLNLDNLPRMATLPGLLEVSIGHALIADAIFLGLAETVRAYLRALGHPG